MGLFQERFEAWEAADFAAYEPAKWASKRFNLERGRVRRRLISLLEQVAIEGAMDTAGLELWTSRDHPNFFNRHKVDQQWAVWCRKREVRERMARFDSALAIERPLDSHIHLGAAIDRDGLRLLLRLPTGARFDQTVRQQLLEALGETGASVSEDGRIIKTHLHFDRDALLEGACSLSVATAWVSGLWSAFRAGLSRVDNDPQGRAEALAAADEAPESQSPDAEPEAEPTPAEIAPARSRSPDPADLKPPTRPARPARPPRPPQQGQRRDGRRGGPPRGDRRRDGPPRSDRRRDGPPRSDRRRDGPPRSDRRPRRRGPPPQRGPYQVGGTKTAKSFDEIAPGAPVRLKGGLFDGKQGVVDAVAGDRIEVTVGVMALSVGRDEVELA